MNGGRKKNEQAINHPPTSEMDVFLVIVIEFKRFVFDIYVYIYIYKVPKLYACLLATNKHSMLSDRSNSI